MKDFDKPCITPRMMCGAALLASVMSVGVLWSSYNQQQKIIDELKVKLSDSREECADLYLIREKLTSERDSRYSPESLEQRVSELMTKKLDDADFQDIVLAHRRARHDRLVDELTDEERRAFENDPFGRFVQLIRSGKSTPAAIELDRDFLGRDRSGDDI
jgi:hypothetical protein